MKHALLGSLCEFANGGTPSKSVTTFWDGDIPWITSADIVDGSVCLGRSFISEQGIENSATNRVREGTVLLVSRTGVGKVAQAPTELCFSQDITAIKQRDSDLNPRYLVRFLETHQSHFERLARGATIKGITREAIAQLRIPLPPLDKQRRIAAILDKADALRHKRKRALELLDGIIHLIFLNMFGDPAINARNYPLRTFGEIAEKMSDGPFGSNLKSSHYVEDGIRVIRLQNIGVGEFIDQDKAFISTRHFKTLSKHECLPGDVLVGTLGDPNLRACLQPKWIPVALNKADCVQIRPNRKLALPEYVIALLNQPSTERLAHGLILGQTRARISMGRLRELAVPIAPLEEQIRFAGTSSQVSKMRDYIKIVDQHVESLFSSLQHRAFSGQL